MHLRLDDQGFHPAPEKQIIKEIILEFYRNCGSTKTPASTSIGEGCSITLRSFRGMISTCRPLLKTDMALFPKPSSHTFKGTGSLSSGKGWVFGGDDACGARVSRHNSPKALPSSSSMGQVSSWSMPRACHGVL